MPRLELRGQVPSIHRDAERTPAVVPYLSMKEELDEKRAEYEREKKEKRAGVLAPLGLLPFVCMI
jgi:hypothetical protein